MSDTISTTAEVRTGLYIGGEERQTDRDPRHPRPGQAGRDRRTRRSRHTAGRRRRDRRGEGRVPRMVGSVRATERAEQMRAALEGIAEERDADAAILSQENGKIRFEAWIDSLVFEIRWNLALMLADEVDTGKTLPVVPGIPVETTVSYQPLGVVTVIVPFNWPIAILGAALPHALLAGNTAIVKPPPSAPLATHPRRPAHRREAARRRAQRRHGQGRRHGGPHHERRRREGLLHRQRGRRQAHHGDGVEVADPRHARARRERRRGVPRRRDPRRHAPRPHLRRRVRHDRADLHERQAAVRAPLAPGRAGRRACPPGSTRP